MEEGSVYDSFPDLTELENKIVMKTPESLLRWMQGDASLGAEWSSNRPEGRDNRTSDSLTDKIRNLKLEMGCLRATDVRILHQLVTVHEAMEAVRWLLEERGTLASRGSSLTSSQCSLAEGPGSGLSPCREGLSLALTSWQSPLNDANEEPEEFKVPDSISGDSYFHMLTNAVSCNDTGLTLEGVVRPPERTGETGTPHCGLPERQGASDGEIVGVEEQTIPSCEVLLGYDTQWCWVESQDDVTFL
ncbi:leucine rich adaptor protein 1-like [Oncorhynchus kisutch]|uniref:leucine rich adaptor protein 1-like n=1 Tax=Oncorhynchus kisutch TaxID=8019 RepID=UPI0009A07790|nr:leucine rich adaptor protein 1-like [Oncorhynchus kisutch]